MFPKAICWLWIRAVSIPLHPIMRIRFPAGRAPLPILQWQMQKLRTVSYHWIKSRMHIPENMKKIIADIFETLEMFSQQKTQSSAAICNALANALAHIYFHIFQNAVTDRKKKKSTICPGYPILYKWKLCFRYHVKGTDRAFSHQQWLYFP